VKGKPKVKAGQIANKPDLESEGQSENLAGKVHGQRADARSSRRTRAHKLNRYPRRGRVVHNNAGRQLQVSRRQCELVASGT
jgi:uncharacterized protein YjbJ (UPF0337 family)